MTTAIPTVLWTSGWDSTYRVAHLVLVERRAVQPIYVLDEDRRSHKHELAALERIRRALIDLDPTVADRLLPTTVRPLSRVPTNKIITDKWRELARSSFIGTQYDWLARMAESRNEFLELSIHRDDKAHGFLVGNVKPGPGGVYVLDARLKGAITLFRRFTFPIFDMTKIEMYENASAKGFAHIMEMTWFCATPLLDARPCGYCNPCRYTREEGLGERVPPHTAVRHAQYIVLSTIVKVRGRIRMASSATRRKLQR